MRGKKQKEPAGMNPAEIFAALELLEKERGIPQTFMMDKIIQAITTAYKRDHEGVENVIVDVDEEHRDLKMFVQKNVVDEEDYVDPANEMTLEEAKALSARYEIGDVVNIPVDKMEFGRIAAGNGKQVIIQGLREAERGMVYDEFNSKQHEILTGVVTRVDPRNGNVSLRIGTGTESTEALLMSGEQVPGEDLAEGMHVKVYVVDVPSAPAWDPRDSGWPALSTSCGAKKSISSSTAKIPPSLSPPRWPLPRWWTCGWRTRARPAAAWCRTTSFPWPLARRGRTPAWRPA